MFIGLFYLKSVTLSDTTMINNSEYFLHSSPLSLNQVVVGNVIVQRDPLLFKKQNKSCSSKPGKWYTLYQSTSAKQILNKDAKVIAVAPSPVECSFPSDEFIVSKTDLKGNITYANRTFMKICNMSEKQLLGFPHNTIRHPDMPRGVFYGLWQCLKSEKEFFGFVKNITADGNYYWVFANITPDYVDGKIVGYYSVRRRAPRSAVSEIESIYAQMSKIESNSGKGEASQASWKWLTDFVQSNHQSSYEQFILDVYETHLAKRV